VGYDPDDPTLIIAAGAVAGAALTLEHVLLWHKAIRLEREHAYVLGTATLGIAFAAWALPARQYRALAAAFTIATMGGLPVMAAYWLRRRLEAEHRAGLAAGRIIGEGLSDAAPRSRDGASDR